MKFRSGIFLKSAAVSSIKFSLPFSSLTYSSVFRFDSGRNFISMKSEIPRNLNFQGKSRDFSIVRGSKDRHAHEDSSLQVFPSLCFHSAHVWLSLNLLISR